MRTYNVVRYHTNWGQKPAIVREGNKYVYAIYMDAPIRVVRLKKSELYYMEPIEYDLVRFAGKLLEAGKRLGITLTARRELMGVVQ